MPIEVKYKPMTAPEVTKALKSFIEKYKPETAPIVNLKLEKTIGLNKTKVHFMPFYKIMTHPLFG